MSVITQNFDLALSFLKEGGVVAIPTETVYGLAANAEQEQAIRKIYKLKHRPLTHPLIMHVAPAWDLSEWVEFIPNYAKTLIKHFWPGPLTLVMRCKPKVNRLITAGQDTVALRCPSHPIALKLLSSLGVPLVAPSANPFGKVSPTTAQHVLDSFQENELLILDGGRCSVGIESTIIGATDPQQYQILRQGIITLKELKNFIPDVLEITESSIRTPGQLAHHYQPEKPLYCFSEISTLRKFCEEAKGEMYILSFSVFDSASYQFPSSPSKVAYELYYQLRLADRSQAVGIAIEMPPIEKQWDGIRDRIIKASILL